MITAAAWRAARGRRAGRGLLTAPEDQAAMARLITAMDGNAAAVVCATVPVPGLEYAAEALVVKGIGGAA